MTALLPAVAATVIGGLILARIRGVAARAQGTMARVLDSIPEPHDRERWQEELQRVLLEFDGRPIKQFRESKQLICAAECLVTIYARPAQKLHSSGQQAHGAEAEPIPAAEARVLPGYGRSELASAMEGLSYRERRILELRYGLGRETPRSLDQVGETFCITAERVYEIETLGLIKLASLAEAQKLRHAP